MSEEKDRLLNMLKEGKLSEDDYELLSRAIDNKSPLIRSIFSILINPFQKIAGYYALAAGLAIIFSMSYLGVIAKIYFPGILDCLNGSFVKNPRSELNFYVLAYQNMISWLILSILFLISAKIFRQKRIRAIDFFGTVAFSRFPYLIFTAFLSSIRLINPSFMEIDMAKGIQLHPSLMTGLFSLVLSFCLIWQITTYFYALKESSGLVNKKLWTSFIVSIILGEVISSILSSVFV